MINGAAWFTTLMSNMALKIVEPQQLLNSMPHAPGKHFGNEWAYREFGKLTDSLCRLLGYRRVGWLVEKVSRYI